MNVLLTGGAGFIGSHTYLVLADAGHDVVILDDFSNSNPKVVHRLNSLCHNKVKLLTGSIHDEALVESVFIEHRIEAVVHFAAFKAVGESVSEPFKYYQNNVAGLVSLLAVMQKMNCKTLVFSSSCTVYGDPGSDAIVEESPRSFSSPYGHTKLISEQMLENISTSDIGWRVGILRYFNPVGAHASGEIGEDPKGIPDNLMPFIARVAVGESTEVKVFGGDYPTKDGSGARDYIHVMDLAEGHLKSLEALVVSGSHTVNLGTGNPYTVLEVIAAYAEASGKSIPYTVVNRREGDVAITYANPVRAKAVLGWSAQRNLLEMCKSSWHWQSNNPEGYDSEPP